MENTYDPLSCYFCEILIAFFFLFSVPAECWSLGLGYSGHSTERIERTLVGGFRSEEAS